MDWGFSPRSSVRTHHGRERRKAPRFRDGGSPAFRPLAVEACDTGPGTRIVSKGCGDPASRPRSGTVRWAFPSRSGTTASRCHGPVRSMGVSRSSGRRSARSTSTAPCRGEDWTYASDEIACYLQGLPVYTCGYGGQSGAPRSSISIRRAFSRGSPIGTGSSTSPRRSVRFGRRSRRWPSRAYTRRRRASPPRRSSGGSGHCGTVGPFRS